MLRKILGIAPKLESDGSYSPSKIALKLGTAQKTDFENVSYEKYQGKKSKILVIFTEQKKHENAEWQIVFYRKPSGRSPSAYATS